jgi:hypothetical protein
MFERVFVRENSVIIRKPLQRRANILAVCFYYSHHATMYRRERMSATLLRRAEEGCSVRAMMVATGIVFTKK